MEEEKLMKSGMKILFVVLLILGLGRGTAGAQTTGGISGTVTDTTGALLPGVDVNVTQTGTGAVRNAVTNEVGSYVFTNLALGPYRLEASLPGFQTYSQTGILLQIGSSPVINAVLEVGQITQTIEVQANTVMVADARQDRRHAFQMGLRHRLEPFRAALGRRVALGRWQRQRPDQLYEGL